MRDGAYWLFALVAWPAAGWGLVELVLRAVTGYGDGLGGLLALTAGATGTIVASHWRRNALRTGVSVRD